VAKDSSVEKLILRLKDWYFEKEGKIFSNIETRST
jgi:hypothetical protein